MEKKVTIRDIAEETGLSPTSISLTLNNRANRISPAKRQLVLETAKRMGYRPPHSNAAHAAKQSRLIMQIVPDLANSFFSNLIHGVDMIANANGYKILLCSTDNDPRREVQLLRSLSELSIDGLLLTSTPATPAQRYAEILSTLKIPHHFPGPTRSRPCRIPP